MAMWAMRKGRKLVVKTNKIDSILQALTKEWKASLSNICGGLIQSDRGTATIGEAG